VESFFLGQILIIIIKNIEVFILPSTMTAWALALKQGGSFLLVITPQSVM